jgi:hypothetical protein
VPLEHAHRRPPPEKERIAMPPKPVPRLPPPPEPRQPLRFKVVDLMTEEVLAQDVSAGQAVDLLEQVRAVVDVRIYVSDPEKGWRLLTLGEQKALWELRGQQVPTPTSSAA